MSSLKQTTLHNISVVSLAQIILRILSLIRYIVVARILSPADFGLFALAQAWLMLSKRFEGLGLETALIQKQNLPKNALLYSFWLKVCSALFFFILIWVSAPALEAFYQFDLFSTVFRVLGLVLIFNLPGYLSRIALTKSLYFKKISFIQAVGGFVNVVSTITFALSGWGVWALVGGVFIGEITTSIFYFIEDKETFIQAFKIKFDFKKIKKETKELLIYSRPIFGAALVAFFITRLDDLIVGKLLGPVQLGFYSIAFTWGNILVTGFVAASTRVFFPTLASVQKNLTKVKKGFLQALLGINLVIAPLSLALFVTAPMFIELILGEKWLPAAPALQILALYGWFRGIGGVGGSMRKAIGHPQIQFKLGLLFLGIMLALVFPLTLKWGIKGTALALLIPSVITNLLAFWANKRLLSLKWKEYLPPLLYPLLISLAMAFSLSLICDWLSFVPAVIIVGILYLGAIWLVYRTFLKNILQMFVPTQGKR